MVAFVGSSGVGKTTLLNLLPRFYDPTRGALQLDGHDLRKVKVEDLRRHVALVLQENVILPTTVAENIAYGRPEATDAQIRHAAELAGGGGVHRKAPAEVRNADQRERQQPLRRPAAADRHRPRAADRGADHGARRADQRPGPPARADDHRDARATLKRQRTIILVSHRLSTVIDCDQIFVMDEGRIVERGTHDELVARHGLYFEMAKHQMKLEDTPVEVPS